MFDSKHFSGKCFEGPEVGIISLLILVILIQGPLYLTSVFLSPKDELLGLPNVS